MPISTVECRTICLLAASFLLPISPAASQNQLWVGYGNGGHPYSFQLYLGAATQTDSETSRTPPLGVSIQPRLPGLWSWERSNTVLRFTPDSGIQLPRSFGIDLSAPLRATTGELLSVPVHLDIPGPFLDWHSPRPADPGEPIVARFSEPLAEPVTQPIFDITPSIAGSYHQIDEHTWEFRPETDWKDGITYHVSQAEHIIGAAGGRTWEGKSPFEFTIKLEITKRPYDFIAVTDSIEVEFNFALNQPLVARDGATVWPGVSITPEVPGTFHWPSANTLRFTPDRAFISGVPYVVRFDSTFSAANGRTLPQAEFSVKPGLRLLSNSAGTPHPSAPMSAYFSTTMARDSITLADPPRGLTITPDVAATYHLKGRVFEVRPTAAFTPGVTYALAFDTTWAAADGTTLTRPTVLNISVPPPTVVATWPLNVSQGWVENETILRVVTTSQLDPDSLVAGATIAPARDGPPHCDEVTAIRLGALGQRALVASDSTWYRIDPLMLGTARVVSLKPTAPLPRGCVATLSWDRGANAPFRTAGDLTVALSNNLPQDTSPGSRSFDFEFSNPIPLRNLHRHLHIEPAVPLVGLRPIQGGAPLKWRLTVSLAAQTGYAFTIDTGLTDAFGNQLVEPLSFRLTTGTGSAIPKPYIELDQRQRTIGLSDTMSVTVRSVGIPAFVVCASPVPPGQEAAVTGDYWWRMVRVDSLEGPGTRCRRISANTDGDTIVSIVSWPSDSLPASGGLFGLRLFHPNIHDTRDRAVVHRTNLAVLAQVGQDVAAVMVTDRSTGAAVVGAEVRVLDCAGGILATFATDSAGVGRASGLLAVAHANNLGCVHGSWRRIIVSTASDRDAFNLPRTFGEGGTIPWPTSLSVTPRRRYRPGQNIRFQHFVTQLGHLETAEDSLRWVIVGEDTTRLMRPRFVVDTIVLMPSTGFLETNYRVPDTLASGLYQSALLSFEERRWRQLSTTVFRVTRQPSTSRHLQIKVPWESGVFGQLATVHFNSWSETGMLSTGAIVRWTARLGQNRPATQLKGFVFRPALQAPGTSDSIFASGTADLDPDGNGSVTFDLPTPLDDWPRTVEISARVFDGGDSAAASHTTMELLPHAHLIGARYQRGDLGRNLDTDSVELVVTNPRGDLISGIPITGVLLNRRWSLEPARTVTGPGPSGLTTRDTVDQCRVLSGPEPVTCRFNPDFLGWFDREFETVTAGDTVTSAIDQIWVRPARNTLSSAIQIPPSKTTIQLASAPGRKGEPVFLEIVNGFDRAAVWLTVQGREIMHQSQAVVARGNSILEIPTNPDWPDQLAVSALIWPTATLSSTKDTIRTPEAHLLELTFPPERLKPMVAIPSSVVAGDSFQIELEWSRTDGVEMRAVVWAIDLHAISAVPDQVPDPTILGSLRTVWQNRVHSFSPLAPLPVEPVDPGSIAPNIVLDRNAQALQYAPYRGPSTDQFPDAEIVRFIGQKTVTTGQSAEITAVAPLAPGVYVVRMIFMGPGRMPTTVDRVVDVTRKP